MFQHTAARRRLGAHIIIKANDINGFNTQPPEGGWFICVIICTYLKVSTHSRPKAAGYIYDFLLSSNQVSTHSRPKAAGRGFDGYSRLYLFQHTAARRRLEKDLLHIVQIVMFQHTAARRRLEPLLKALLHQVSQP